MIGEKTAIFIDTNVFEKMNFNFDTKNKILSFYKKLLSTKKYENILVSVINNEIIEHIKNKVLKDESNIKKHYRWIYDLLDNKIIEEKLYKSLTDFEKFKLDTKTEILDLKKVNSELVMQKYFNLEYPFEVGKRYEFKDAFFLEAIYQYAKDNDTYISFIVITNDNGVKKAIDNQKNKKIIYYDSIEEFIDSLNECTKISKDNIQEYLNKYDFLSQIQDQININIANIEEEEIEIDHYEYNGILFPKIIKKLKNKITIICDMSISLIGNFRCLDYNNSYYSNEESEYIYKQYVERSFLMYFCQTIIEIDIKDDKFENATIVDLPEIDIDYEAFINIDDYFE